MSFSILLHNLRVLSRRLRRFFSGMLVGLMPPEHQQQRALELNLKNPHVLTRRSTILEFLVGALLLGGGVLLGSHQALALFWVLFSLGSILLMFVLIRAIGFYEPEPIPDPLVMLVLAMRSFATTALQDQGSEQTSQPSPKEGKKRGCEPGESAPKRPAATRSE